MNLSDYNKMNHLDLTNHYRNYSKHNELMKNIAENCVKNDLSNHQKFVFPNMKMDEVNVKIRELYTKNVECINIISKIETMFKQTEEQPVSVYEKSLFSALEITKRKVILNNKLIDAIDSAANQKNVQKIQENVASFVLGSQYAKQDELSYWKEVSSNYNNREIPSKVFEYLPLIVAFSVSVVAIIAHKFFKSRQQEVESE